MITFLIIPPGTGVADWTTGREVGAVVREMDDDGPAHPQMITKKTREILRRTETLRIKNRVGLGVVIPFLSRTGYRPVHGNRS